MSDVKPQYDEDFVLWSKSQAEALRAASRGATNQPIDWENVAEEIESLGISQKAALRSQMRRIVHHLLKLEFSRAAEPRRGWIESVGDARSEIEDLLELSPSLKSDLRNALPLAFRQGSRKAIFDLENTARLIRRSSPASGRGLTRSIRFLATGSRRSGRMAKSHDEIGGDSAGARAYISDNMIDPFGRTITYLRVSVTDRCDFRCVYCMAEEMEFLPKRELLTLEELDRVCSAFVRLGVKKLRLTGGEPLVRRDIMTLFRSLGRHLDSGALEELTLTTNGSQLARYADELRACGVRRVNVSVDTLDPAKFTEITRRGRLDQVLDGLAAAKQAGLAVKINTVARAASTKMNSTTSSPGAATRASTSSSSRSCRWETSAARTGSSNTCRCRWCGPPAAALDARRKRLPHGGPARYVDGARDRAAPRLHHAADSQFLRKLQPRAADLYRHAVHVPRTGGRRGSAHAVAPVGGRRGGRSSDPRSHRSQAQGPRFHHRPAS